jgi:5-methylthioadenosine/S-adenosylhomocysteine deaminase
MIEADLIVKADYVLPMDEDHSVIRDGAVAVIGGKVAFVGSAEEVSAAYSAGRVLGGEDTLLLPGLINTHTHSPMVYFRGLADDLPLKEWLEKYIWPAEERWLSPEFVSDAAELACLEMLKAGITVFNDMYFFGHEIASTAKRLGMKAVVGAGILDFPTKTASSVDDYLANASALIEAWKGDDYITPCIAL